MSSSSVPEGTTVVKVVLVVDCEVCWRLAGQLITPVDKQFTPVYVISVVMVAVLIACLLFITWEVVMLFELEVVIAGLPCTAQPGSRVVDQIGIVVAGTGPHVLSLIAIDAPARAPTAN